MPPESRARLPCPGVVFEPGFARRLERLVPRLSLARERREGAGRPGLSGGGTEVLGHRPYRPGDDLRDLDWSALARLRRPIVRVTAREAGERWLVVLDASASMGVGPPGKLQRAAEVAAGIAALGIRLRAEVRIHVPREAGAAPDIRRAEVQSAACDLRVRTRADLAYLLAFLEGQRAEGVSGPLHRVPALAGASRVFLVGDLCGTQPAQALSLLGRRRDLFVIRILAPLEVAPADLGLVEWRDPESGARASVPVDAESRAAYGALLEREIQAWSAACALHGARHVAYSSAAPFEEILERSLFG